MPKWLLKNYLCMCLWGCLWERLAFESVDWVKKIALTIWWASHSPSGAWIEQKHRGRVYSLYIHSFLELRHLILIQTLVSLMYIHIYIYISCWLCFSEEPWLIHLSTFFSSVPHMTAEFYIHDIIIYMNQKFCTYLEIFLKLLRWKWSEVKVAQLCLTPCNPMDYIVHGIL